MGKEAVRRWQTTDSLRLRWRCWDNEHIAFNCNSGDIHLLNPIAAEALKSLQRSAFSVDGLVQSISESLNIANDSDLYHNVHQFVLKLARLGLVHPVDDSC
ncbi:PqqD family protein, HPr-rel-A system [Geoalkalibacter ferrihydriticus]|uniref:HPr-rel-A system PqqD family protein n=2 Tax=Geoalkalibacter ferrihydriticus TaxID=392333 RepID=A0A0C2EB75_9BACT|nr:HPr-rel-A system PqqD family peptide chaperone [Geoalkalibacter ferrihydriticus]KIH75848.1 hypothetical protein GFER_14800 [Geoalkalibacter ferrihydriticus DSM 17813]SDM67946.1 PqqD family protein, HPr-rel-A system [Geoalkalibacter ferrihydriticus]